MGRYRAAFTASFTKSRDARLAVAARALGRTEQAATHEAEAQAALLRHRAEQRRWAEALGAVDPL